MKNFKDFNLKPTVKGFTGEKIKIARILNKPISVHDYRIVDSKFENKGKRLDLQIKVDGEMRVIFTSGISLMALIQQIPKGEMPFNTTIIKENDMYTFS